MTVEEIPAVNRLLKKAFHAVHAPIIELVAAQTNDPFHVLLGTILSARTKDACTAGACGRLFAEVNTPEDLERIPIERLEQLIFPVGFYHEKAKHLKALPAVLKTKFGGVLPDTVEALCELPGVGRKIANLILGDIYGKPAIVADTHCIRISNRLGLSESKVPEKTEKALEALVTPETSADFCHRLVMFGREVCSARAPKCGECPVKDLCEKNFKVK